MYKYLTLPRTLQRAVKSKDRSCVVAAVGVCILLSACAAKVLPTPIVGAPRYPEFAFPSVPLEFGDELAAKVKRAWAFLQSGDLQTSGQEFSVALQKFGGFYPAEVGLGYVELAQSDYATAMVRFDRSLSIASNYVPALVGRGEALLGEEREQEALSSFEAALNIDPSLVAVRRRVEVIRVQGLQRNVEEARIAALVGRDSEAALAYRRAITASPESAFLYRELAIIEQRQGNEIDALEHMERATVLDPNDAMSLRTLGELYEGRGQYDEAIETYTRANEVEPTSDLITRIEKLMDRVEFERLPGEFRAISSLSEVTRADLAALLGVRLQGLIERNSSSESVLITDIRSHWASSWIMTVASAGFMEVYPNHTFEPSAVIDRGDLAEVVSRTLGAISSRAPTLAREWKAESVSFVDLRSNHPSYPSAELSVAAGILRMTEDGSFGFTRIVTGTEVVDAIGRLEVLVELVSGLSRRH